MILNSKILPRLVGTLVVPSLCEIIDFEWDTNIKRQNKKLTEEIKNILLHFRNTTFKMEKEFIDVQTTLLESLEQSLRKQIFNYLKILPKNKKKVTFNSLSWQIWEIYWFRRIHLLNLIFSLKEILLNVNVIYMTNRLIDESIFYNFSDISDLIFLTDFSIISLIKCFFFMLDKLNKWSKFPLPYIIIYVSLFCQNLPKHIKFTKQLKVQLLAKKIL